MAAPKIRQIPISELHIDDHYQRLIRSKHAAKIVDNYNPNLLGVLTVNDRSGVLFVIDGHHRLTAAGELGLHTVPCHVLVGLTAQQEAEVFYQLNLTRLKVSAFERFNALRYMGDERALDIDRLIRKYGWTAGASAQRGYVNALEAIAAVYNRDGHEGLDETFAFIKTTWNGSDRATEGQMISGVAHFLRHATDRVDLEAVSRKVAMAQPAQILSQATYQNRQRGGGIASNVAREILAVYDKGRRSKTRIAL